MKSLKLLFFYLLIISLDVGRLFLQKRYYTTHSRCHLHSRCRWTHRYFYESNKRRRPLTNGTSATAVHRLTKALYTPMLRKANLCLPYMSPTSSGQTYEGSTVIRLSKGSPIKLDDNTLADWDTVKTNMITSGPKGGIFRELRFDYDGSFIYFYISMMSKKSNGDIFDFYIDADNNAGTGFITSLFTNAGMDVLMEGAMLDNWFDVFYHSGAQNSFSFDPQSINEFYKIGTIVESGGLLKFEGRINRSKIAGLTGKGLKIGITATKSDWSVTLGNAPDDGSPAFFLDTSD